MIILSGASGGVGKEIIKHLLKMDDVIGIYNSSHPAAPTGNGLVYEKVDIGKPAGIKSFVKKWGHRLSKITLIHGAAVKIDGLSANYTEADWDKVMRVNLKGNFLLTQALLPHMLRERWGRIIHFSSLGGMQGGPGTIAYSASKTGLIGMSRVLAKEYARFNITSNVLAIGYFEVGLFNALNNDEKKKILNKIPSKKLGGISNIANAVEFLMKSDYVNGAIINIDGGAD
ncbi:MAG: SDR family NAD(P)-dependent oxidoreductase [Candidatus Omnitrophica bacterium]|nr:SDR family NAD(P)-dependent oxidoreductase [Candidatus Omnitrophota bacterium]